MRLGLDVRLTYYTRGGTANYIRHLAARLPALGPDDEHVHLYRRGHAAAFSPQARRVDCWTPAHHRLERFTLAVETLPLRLDLLHSPDFIPPLFGHRRSVITVHDLAFLLYPDFLTEASRRYYNEQIDSAVRHAHLIIAVSNATKLDLVSRLGVPADKIIVIHHGLDPEFRPLSAEAVRTALASVRLEPGYLLFVGTFEPRKNVAGLLRAYACLRADLPDAPPLVLAGNKGWLFAETMQSIQALNLAGNVRYLEDVPPADLPGLYNGAGVFILPSHYEGFGLPVLEAMGCGVPTIVADRAALPEIAGGAALLIDPDDPDALADALRRVLIDSALRAELQRKGYENIKRFTWEQSAQSHIAAYRQALSS
jgi:glycosyltransferase involved in cell wall biosynthesis